MFLLWIGLIGLIPSPFDIHTDFFDLDTVHPGNKLIVPFLIVVFFDLFLQLFLQLLDLLQIFGLSFQILVAFSN